MMNYKECEFITQFRGDRAKEFATHKEYVEMGDWGVDYLFNWLEGWGSDELPSLDEIGDCCKTVAYYIGHWLDGVEAGVIDPEAGVEN